MHFAIIANGYFFRVFQQNRPQADLGELHQTLTSVIPMLHRLEFGYFPEPLDLASGSITVCPLADLALTVANVEGDEQVEQDWIYAPPQLVRNLSGGVRERPYSARVFALPKTHTIAHASCDGQDHLTFHLWALSFFTGMRLTATEAGFVDATPIKPGELVDFVLLGQGIIDALALAEAFWISHRSAPERFRLIAAAVHALFLAQNPQHLQFEKFILLYTAIDACFALAKAIRRPANAISHARRVKWMCDAFGMPTPAWADPTSGAEVASLRNKTVHEALFMGEPLGFAIHGTGTNQNLTLEMQALICRFVVALLGAESCDYVRSPVNTREQYGLSLATP